MDKKSKKRLALLQEKVQRLRQQISAEKKQPDEPETLVHYEKDLSELLKEIEALQATK